MVYPKNRKSIPCVVLKWLIKVAEKSSDIWFTDTLLLWHTANCKSQKDWQETDEDRHQSVCLACACVCTQVLNTLPYHPNCTCVFKSHIWTTLRTHCPFNMIAQHYSDSHLQECFTKQASLIIPATWQIAEWLVQNLEQLVYIKPELDITRNTQVYTICIPSTENNKFKITG